MAAKNLLILVCVALVVPRQYAAFNVLNQDPICEDFVDACFAYCEDFVDGSAGYTTHECCNFLKILNKRVKYVDNGVRRYCQCIEDFSNSHYHLPYAASRVKDLNLNCGIHLSFPISEHMDCSKL